MPKKKGKDKDKSKEAKLVVRLDADLHNAFLERCLALDTTASREVRRLIRHFLASNGDPYAPAGAEGVTLPLADGVALAPGDAPVPPPSPVRTVVASEEV